MENTEEVKRAIENLAAENGYHPRIRIESPENTKPATGTRLYMAFEIKEGDIRPTLYFIVTICSSRYRITLPDDNASRHYKDFNQLLEFLEDWLLKQKAPDCIIE